METEKGLNTFSLLRPEVAKLATDRFKKPTKIQKLAIPKIISGKNTLAISNTGSGKTESVLLPIFDKLVNSKPKPIAILYISPLRSLSRDLLERILWWSNRLDFGVTVRHGDTSARERKLQVEHPDELFIITPEQLQPMLTGKKLRELLKNVKYVVIDEAHELIDSKRGVQLMLALERLRLLCGEPQIIALSATVGTPEKAAKFLFNGKKHVIVNAKEETNLDIKVESPFPKPKDRIIAEKINLSDSIAARLRKIHELMLSHKAVLTFTNTREASEMLSSRLRVLDRELKHEVHHSSLGKEVRLKAERGFKEEELKSLIATSSLQLGIDIGLIDLVIQYMSPREVTQLLQRVGRSGHGVERISKGIIIATEADDIFEAAVIARKAMKGELERPRFHKDAMDVLAHQIVGMAMEEYDIKPEKVYETLKRAYPFKDLTAKEFNSIIEFLRSLRLIYLGNGIRRCRRSFEYYFTNLSVIPDSISYKIIDMTTGTMVGTLDEAFVAEHSETGSSFIVKGRPWRVISVENDKVFVEPITGLESSVPAWEGELIPVPFEVAQEVGALRRQAYQYLKGGKKKTEIAKKIKEKYPVSSQTASKMVWIINRQSKKFPVPDNRSITVEHAGDFTVLHCCFGSLVNETLARYISAILTAEQGRVVQSKTDPYRIIFSNVQPENIVRILKDIKPEQLHTVLALSLPRSSLYKHRFIQIAKRFGAIMKGAKYDKINVDNIIKVYRDSPIAKETLRELFTEKLDVKQTEKIIRSIRSKKLKIHTVDGLSLLGELGLQQELHDIAKPDRPEAEILRIFKKRLLSTKMRLVCLNCGKYSVSYKVKEIPKVPRCPRCTSKLLACIHPHMTEAKEIIKKRLQGKRLTDEEQKKLQRIKMSADVIVAYGKRGAIVLAGRGVGPTTAKRIMRKCFAFKDDDKFYKETLREERNFLTTHRYWQT
ncbi:MAG: DEAD/DEAH box helicase [Candidatus Aenigmatarchaeota archaeon]